jgi:hypothetical protein
MNLSHNRMNKRVIVKNLVNSAISQLSEQRLSIAPINQERSLRAFMRFKCIIKE